MITLQNNTLSIAIHQKGAELQSLQRKDNGLQYLWSGDPAFWGKHSPILFPFVGSLKGDTYYYEGSAYHLPRHGFARDMEFTIAILNDQEAIFTLRDSPATRSNYPFAFELNIRYKLEEQKLTVKYEVNNPASSTLYFSVGGHPAFAAPLIPGTNYEDYYLQFSQPETLGRRVLQDGLLKEESEPFLQNEARIPLTHQLFEKDAIVIHGFKSNSISLLSNTTPHGLTFGIQSWPDLGLWAAPNAPFVCIEPWSGHADLLSANQELTGKEGIIALPAGGKWEKSWWVEVF